MVAPVTDIMQIVVDVACVALGVWLAYHASEGTFSKWCDRKHREYQASKRRDITFSVEYLGPPPPWQKEAASKCAEALARKIDHDIMKTYSPDIDRPRDP